MGKIKRFSDLFIKHSDLKHFLYFYNCNTIFHTILLILKSTMKIHKAFVSMRSKQLLLPRRNQFQGFVNWNAGIETTSFLDWKSLLKDCFRLLSIRICCAMLLCVCRKESLCASLFWICVSLLGYVCMCVCMRVTCVCACVYVSLNDVCVYQWSVECQFRSNNSVKKHQLWEKESFLKD